MPSARFLLTSTREVAVDSLDFIRDRYTLALADMQKEFTKSLTGVALASVGWRQEIDGSLHLQFLPTSMSHLRTLTDPIDQLEGIVQRPKHQEGVALRLRLGAHQLVGQVALREAWSNLKSDIQEDTTAHLYRAIPYNISGPDISATWLPPSTEERLTA